MKILSFRTFLNEGKETLEICYRADNPEEIYEYRGMDCLQDLIDDELVTVLSNTKAVDMYVLLATINSKYNKRALEETHSLQEFMITLADSIYSLTDSVRIVCESCNSILDYSDRVCPKCSSLLTDRTYTEQELVTKFDKDHREITPRQVFIILNGLRKREQSGVADLHTNFINVRRCMRNLPYISIDGIVIRLNDKSFTISDKEPATSALEGLSSIGYEFM